MYNFHWFLFVSFGFASLLCGCDKTEVIVQEIELEILDLRGDAIEKARISMKETWASWSRGSTTGNEALLRERWRSGYVPTLVGTTDDKGIAIIIRDTEILYAGEDEIQIDFFSGKQFSIEVEIEGTTRVFEMTLKNLESVEIEGFYFQVKRISSPRFTE